jgi:hypothetical protein
MPLNFAQEAKNFLSQIEVPNESLPELDFYILTWIWSQIKSKQATAVADCFK